MITQQVKNLRAHLSKQMILREADSFKEGVSVAILITGLFLFCALAGCSLDSNYFDPRKTDSYSLSGGEIPSSQIEQVSFTSGSETIYGVFAKAATFTADTKTILYFHGDDKDIDKWWPRISHLYGVSGINVFIFDYQGYGKSTGKPSLKAAKQNSKDALAYLKTRGDVNPTKIVYYGFSLGSVMGLELTKTDPPLAFIGENIPASSGHIISGSTGIDFSDSFVLNETFDNLGHLNALQKPVLIFAARQDETVPFDKNAIPVFNSLRQPKTTIVVDNASHSNLIDKMGVQTYRERIQTFFSDNSL